MTGEREKRIIIIIALRARPHRAEAWPIGSNLISYTRRNVITETLPSLNPKTESRYIDKYLTKRISRTSRQIMEYKYPTRLSRVRD